MSSQELTKKDKISLIRQSNDITESGRDMSAQEQNIMYMWLAQMSEDDPEDKIYRIYVKDLEKITNTQINYSQLKSSFIEKFVKKAFDIKTDNGRKQFPLLAAARYKKTGSIIELDIHPDIRKYFFGLKRQYTLFQFTNAIKLKSKYSKWIYEMLSQFKSQYKIQLAKNEECIIKISVQELKERFKLIDLETGYDKYSNFGVFAQNVLDPAQKEINDNTEIFFEWNPLKPTNGKKIKKLQFKIIDVKGIEELSDLSADVPTSLKELFVSTEESKKKLLLEERLVNDFKISKVLAKDISEAFPVEKTEYVMKGITKENETGKITKLGAYAKTIFQDWLNGAEPTFEKVTTSLKHTPLKAASESNQLLALANEIQKQLYVLGIDRNTVYVLMVKYGGNLESLENLESAIIQVKAAIESEEVDTNPASIYEFLKKKMNGDSKEINQPLVNQSSERLNSANSLGSLLSSSMRKPSMQIETETAEEEKIRREKVAIWQELVGRFRMDDQEADKLVEHYPLLALNSAISKVVESLQNQKIQQESNSMLEELYRNLNLA